MRPLLSILLNLAVLTAFAEAPFLHTHRHEAPIWGVLSVWLRKKLMHLLSFRRDTKFSGAAIRESDPRQPQADVRSASFRCHHLRPAVRHLPFG